jgi:1-deoxy-D-xylulose-5-phosphate synthase
MPDGTGLIHLHREMPDRFFDVGIAEQHAVTFAAGMATEGFVPVVAIYSTFLQRAFDQVVHDCALQDLHVVFVLDRGGLVGADGPTHHGTLDLSYLRCIPNMVVMAPKDEQELRDMLFTAVQYGKGPIALRYPRGNAVGVPVRPDFKELPIGRSETLRTGRDIALLAVGTMANHALDAAAILAQQGVEAEVVNVRFVKPLDLELLKEVSSRIPAIMTIEDNVIVGGFGSGVCEALQDLGRTAATVKVHGLPDGWVEHGTPSELYRLVQLDAAGIAETAMSFLRSRETHGVSA